MSNTNQFRHKCDSIARLLIYILAHLNIHAFSLRAAAEADHVTSLSVKCISELITLSVLVSSFFSLSFSSSLCFSSFPLEKVSRSFYKLIKIWCCMKPIWLWTGAYWSHRWSRDQHFKQNELFQRRVWNGRRTLIWKPQQPTKPTQRVTWQRQWPHFVFHLF